MRPRGRSVRAPKSVIAGGIGALEENLAAHDSEAMRFRLCVPCVPAAISNVPAAVPLVTQAPVLLLESMPVNTTSAPSTVKFEGARPGRPLVAHGDFICAGGRAVGHPKRGIATGVVGREHHLVTENG